jgi:hypothetical protein
MDNLKPTKMAVGVGLLGVFGSVVFSSLLALLPRFYEITSLYMYADVLSDLVVLGSGTWVAIVIPGISAALSYIYILKGFETLSVIFGFIFGGAVLSIGYFLIGFSYRYITSPTIPENYNLYPIISVGLVVVFGSAIGILLGIFTGEPAKETLDRKVDL